MVDVRPLAAWCNEREAIRLRKAVLENQYYAGPDSQGPSRRVLYQWWDEGQWTLDHLTDDPILQKFRFCNVRRQDDRVSRWITQHISEPFAQHEHLWLMLAISRYINWPPTLKKLIYASAYSGNNPAAPWPDSPKFTPACLGDWLQKFKDGGDKVWTGAFMIRAESDPAAPWYSLSKQHYVAEIVIGQLWEDRALYNVTLDPARTRQKTLQEVWEALQHYTGWGPFMSGQMVTDLRWTRYLRSAPDINTWTALGPGSRRGLNRLHGRPAEASLTQEKGLAEMLEVREALAQPGVLAPWLPLPELSDVQASLCELDKYERVRLGEGRPRALYVPGRGH